MDLTQHAIRDGSANPLQELGQLVGNSTGAKLMIVALMLSTIATLETTLIQVTRSLFSMSRDRTLPARFGHLLGACFMVYIFIEALATKSVAGVAVWLGIGGIAIGLIPIIYYNAKGSPFLHEKPTLGRVDIGSEPLVEAAR